MTERQISQLSEGEAMKRGVWILWILICQPDRMYSKKDVQDWIKKVQAEKAAKAAGKGKK